MNSCNYPAGRGGLTTRLAMAALWTGLAGQLVRWAAVVGVAVSCGAGSTILAASPADPAVALLAAEVRGKGWVAYGARSAAGDWDLFLCRPDGSGVRSLTRTPGWSEFSPQFSRDGRQLLYRRMPRDETLDDNRHGEQGELVLANADGTGAVVLGKPGELPWASFGPDGLEIASLSIKGVAFYSLARREVVRTLPRKGFFQQVTWSPDGQWLCGVANSFGASWSVARMNAATGEASAVNRVDCCTPDWFPDSRAIIFSWRPPGQKANTGYGWTQLWRAAADGSSRQLVYAEDGRHVYGGHVSPDGKHLLFTGNVKEDGDPGGGGAPMALMRVSDAPVIAGQSPELWAAHPDAKSGPVLVLPVGWEPCWTFSEAPAGAAQTPPEAPSAPARGTAAATGDENSRRLAAELHDQGWIVSSSKTERGDWDLFRMRPDGADREKFIDMPDYNEGGARFSPDGRRVLFYRMPKSEEVQNNVYGIFELVVANADGSAPVVYGTDFAWATWGPDSRQVGCLASKGIQIVDLASRKIVRQLPRKGMVSQLGWSPDGRWFLGTADHLGPYWNIARMDAATGDIAAVSETDRYNCTPDWVSDSRRIVYARGIIPEHPGRAELWAAATDGRKPQPLYAEAGRHIYGACASPDMKYLLFTRSIADLTKVDQKDTAMAVIRWADTPMRGDDDPSLRERFPGARTGPRLDLGPGWEPCWTLADISAPGRTTVIRSETSLSKP